MQNSLVVLCQRCISRGSLNSRRSFSLSPLLYKGHSKWQNTKGIREENARKNNMALSRILSLVKVTVKESGPDITKNSTLRSLYDKAHADNLPKASIDSFVKKMMDTGPGETHIFEGKGPGKTFIVAQASTTHFIKCRDAMRSLFKKRNCVLGAANSAMHAFTQRGVIVATPLRSDMSLEEAEDVAIEIDAEEVECIENDDGSRVFEFVTDPSQVGGCVKRLSAIETFSVESSETLFIPNNEVTISDEDWRQLMLLENGVTSLDDIESFHHNAAAPSSSGNSLS